MGDYKRKKNGRGEDQNTSENLRPPALIDQMTGFEVTIQSLYKVVCVCVWSGEGVILKIFYKGNLWMTFRTALI